MTMTNAAVVYTDFRDSTDAGAALGAQICEQLQGQSPDALILFASPTYDLEQLISAVKTSCHPTIVVGCSSAGEFSSSGHGVESACAAALKSSEMLFTAGIGHGLSTNPAQAAQELVASFRGLSTHDYVYRTALVLSDALAGHADNLVEQLTLLTAGTYQLVGGGAGDDGHFRRTYVFYGHEVVSDAVVALEILSNKPLGIGVSHGWQPASAGMRVTEAQDMCLVSLNASAAVEVFEDHAENTGQVFDQEDPLPFFLHNVIGIDNGTEHRLRVPLGVNGDGSLPCAADIPAGATVRIMAATSASSSAAAATAIQQALQQLEGHRPKVALFFDCVATRLRMGKEFGFELAAVQRELGAAQYAGFNTYGQIARAEGQFSGFHNCTAVVCIIPE